MFDFLTSKFSSIFQKITGDSRLTEKNIDGALQSVHDALLEADVPFEVTKAFIQELKEAAVGQKVWAAMKPHEQFIKIAHATVTRFLGGVSDEKHFIFGRNSQVMVMGLQGSGKTTTLGKLAHMVKSQGSSKILLASVDFYRPAAVDQLEIISKQAGVWFYRARSTDPVEAAREIVKYKQENRFDVLFLDTAGRLHVDNTMLHELQEIDQLVKPTHKLLVLDAMTGQESLLVAKAFDQAVGFDSCILTKLDSDTRGGAAFAFKYTLGKPVQFVGTGEKVEDLEPFRSERFADRILGMGDLLSLVEKANQKIKKEEQERMERSFKGGHMTLDDFKDQLEMVSRMGSLTRLASYIPGMGAAKIPQEQLEQGEREMKKFKAIISSMTRKERVNHKILQGTRKERIAKGAGVRVADVNQLLARFDQLQQFAKLMKRHKGF
ncbi:MAG: signal recognition particle protein [Candidatus Babeliales bacterium]